MTAESESIQLYRALAFEAADDRTGLYNKQNAMPCWQNVGVDANKVIYIYTQVIIRGVNRPYWDDSN